MITYKYGGKNGTTQTLVESPDRVVVRTRNARSLRDAIASPTAREVLENFEVEMEFPDADVSVLRARSDSGIDLRDRSRSVLKGEEELRFAGRVLEDQHSHEPVLYTENLFIKFNDGTSADRCEQILTEHELSVKQKLEYAPNTYFVGTPENTGLAVFDLANSLLELPEVELCHPELIRKRSMRGIHPRQWHLKDTVINGKTISASANVEAAHAITKGENIVVAVIDDGVDIDHPEFRMPGKVVHSRDVSNNLNDPRPRKLQDKHGTACAGVAVASGVQAPGVAPAARLLPIRLSSQLGSIAEGNAFKWAADHGADIISCSWGPADGYWDDPGDPLHTAMTYLPDSTRLAIDYAVRSGRNGKGCVILFAAGNGNEDTAYDGYISYGKVMAVAACNDRGSRSVYSDYGAAVWCCFPSNDFGFVPFSHPHPLTSGIYTTDRTGGAGYGPGEYTDSFGGTSSACPGAAGVAALVLAVNPALSWTQVRQVIRDSCQQIDKANGRYDANGHSHWYGYGRLDALAAVQRAQQLQQTAPQPVRILKAMINPEGRDAGRESVSLLNLLADTDVDLTGWQLKVNREVMVLKGILPKGDGLNVLLNGRLRLPNRGGTLVLLNPQGSVVHEVSYRRQDIAVGKELAF